MKRLFIFVITLILFITVGIETQATSLGDSRSFNIDSSYDITNRIQITAVVKKITRQAYFYFDEDWWNDLDSEKQTKFGRSLDLLGEEFENKIYFILTTNFGSEKKPGIDNDDRITILLHPMKEKAGGYFNSGDGYSKLENPNSNEREMVYLNTDYITSPLAKSFLAHEFVHLITFNQKNKIHNVQEEIWLNEARAEYAPTLVGYDADYQGSNLERRVRTFLESPSDSITEWQGKKEDYGALNLFIQYLVDHYGIEILTDSLKSKEVGIKSLNEALKKNGFEEDFSQIFTDWTITVLANDCFLGEKYCYKNENLENLTIIPSLNFLPIKDKSTLAVSRMTKNWAGNWFKFFGGKGTLRIEFIGDSKNVFKIPYLVKDLSGKYSLNFFQLNERQKGEILVSGLGSEISSVVIIPSIQTKLSNFSNPEQTFSFFWSASITDGSEEENFSKYLDKPISEMSKNEILIKVSEIEDLLNQLKNQLNFLNSPEEVSCQRFNENLFYGLKNDNRVKCLQEFLKNQGLEIYPEGLVTGNFLSLTKAAVIRFQEKYAEDILAPWELIEGTGFVGETTRAKINDILGK